jgi:aerobic-type carbon monoxide dehydrogenase small subunit (CoxS/CutS family)
LINDRPTRACQVPIETLEDQKVITIEGLSEDGSHPLQQAWMEEDVPQCGYCQAAQIMAAAGLLKQKPKPTDQDIDDLMSGNFCRCGTYDRIRKAIHRAAGVTK